METNGGGELYVVGFVHHVGRFYATESFIPLTAVTVQDNLYCIRLSEGLAEKIVVSCKIYVHCTETKAKCCLIAVFVGSL